MENTKNEKNSIEQEEAQSIAENSVISTRSYNAAKYQKMRAEQTYNLIKNAKLHVDLIAKEYRIVIPDVMRKENLMNIEISHVYQPGYGYGKYGTDMRLNICEEVRPSSSLIKGDYQYIDSLGKSYYFFDRYYYVDDGSIVLSQDSVNIQYDNTHDKYTLNGRVVEYEGYTSNGWRFVSEVEKASVENFLNSIQSAVNAVKNDVGVTEDTGMDQRKYYMRKGNQIKVFNNSGCLIQVCDYNGNFVYIKYNESFQVSCIFDNKKNIISFFYDPMLNYLLRYIDDNRGRRVRFSYTRDELSFIEYCTIKNGVVNIYDGLSLNRYIDNDLETPTLILESNDKKCTIVCENNDMQVLKEIAWDPQERKVTFNYSTGYIEMEDQDGFKKSYRYIGEGADAYIENYSESKKGKRIQDIRFYEEFEINGNYILECEYAKRSCLYQENFAHVAGVVKTMKYDGRGLLLEETTTGIEILPTVTKNVDIVNIYDKQHRLIDKGVTETYSTGTAYRYKERYYYNDVEKTDSEGNAYTVYGNVKKKLSWVDGEETTTGFTYVFYTYDENGRLTKTKTVKKKCTCTDTCNCRLLEDSDTLSGFVSEQAYDEQGRLVSRKDETGQHTTSYQYVANTNLLSKTVDPLNVETAYTYDERDRMTKLLCGTSYNTIGYSYDDVAKYGDSTTENYLQFVYDDKKRLSQIKFGDTVYESIEYEKNVDLGYYTVDKVTLTNAKGEKFKIIRDVKGTREMHYYTPAPTESEPNPAEITVADMTYNKYEQLSRLSNATETKTFSYDETGKLILCGGGEIQESIEYGEKGRVKRRYLAGQISRNETYIYENNSRGNITRYTTQQFQNHYTYDEYGRLSNKKLYIGSTLLMNLVYGYDSTNGNVTSLLRLIGDPLNGNLTYFYDDRSNIVKIRKSNADLATYEYDDCNRLIVEENIELGTKTVYQYDTNGNILFKNVYIKDSATGEYVHSDGISYIYENDRMRYYNGEACEYDSVGNPTTYRGHQLVWENGRQLKSFDDTTFTYDGQGKRIAKNGVPYYYDSQGRLISINQEIVFFYDETGVIAFQTDQGYYYYKKDLHGNIIAILDTNRQTVVKYVYDAWGKHKAYAINGAEIPAQAVTHIAHINPFRYRGYFYDRETGLYYLKSRYYDPETGRFINMDGVEYADTSFLNGLNLYAYCNNNPVMNVDPNGNFFLSISMSSLGLAALSGFFIGTGVYYLESTFHPIQNAIESIVDEVENIIHPIDKDAVENNLNIAIEPGDVQLIIEETSLNHLKGYFFSKSQGGGRDSEFVGIPDKALEDMLKDARRIGDTKKILRIIRELKNRGKRNQRKNRKGPHMRSWLLFLLMQYLKGEMDANYKG